MVFSINHQNILRKWKSNTTLSFNGFWRRELLWQRKKSIEVLFAPGGLSARHFWSF